MRCDTGRVVNACVQRGAWQVVREEGLAQVRKGHLPVARGRMQRRRLGRVASVNVGAEREQPHHDLNLAARAAPVHRRVADAPRLVVHNLGAFVREHRLHLGAISSLCCLDPHLSRAVEGGAAGATVELELELELEVVMEGGEVETE